MSKITDPQVSALASLATSLNAEYIQDDDPWEESPFAWIKTQQSRRRGKIGEQLVSSYLEAHGFTIGRSTDSEADRVINGHRTEIKFSTLWQSGVYKFQQVRDQNYSIMVCLGVSPFDAHAWVLPKSILKQHVIGKMGQHGGSGATDTDWISFKPKAPPAWIQPWGGRLDIAVAKLKTIAP